MPRSRIIYNWVPEVPPATYIFLYLKINISFYTSQPNFLHFIPYLTPPTLFFHLPPPTFFNPQSSTSHICLPPISHLPHLFTPNLPPPSSCVNQVLVSVPSSSGSAYVANALVDSRNLKSGPSFELENEFVVLLN